MILFFVLACSETYIEVPIVEVIDVDEDGQSVENGDCDDNDDYVYEGAAGNETKKACYKDRDGDGFGAVAALPPIQMGSDCDDSDPYTFPMPAIDGQIKCLKDKDQDGFGTNISSRLYTKGWDCDDENPKITAHSKDHYDVYDCPSPTPADQRVVRLSKNELDLIWNTAEDKRPVKLDGVGKEQEGLHYVVSNESYPHLFKEAISNKGGAFLGVGTEQTYLMMGWQNPQIAWLMDYDVVIKRIHMLYALIFIEAETPTQFLDIWSRLSTANEVDNLVKNKSLTTIQKGVVLETALKYQKKIYNRLTFINHKLNALQIPHFLNDINQYKRIRALIKSKRIRSLVGNLKDNVAMKAIGESAEALKIPIRVLYISNAEQYWSYTKQYIANMKALYTDSTSVTVRTLLNWSNNQDYHYVVQPFHQYLKWLETNGVSKVRDIIPHRKDSTSEVLYTYFDQQPPHYTD